MSLTADRFGSIVKHVWTEPRFVAQVEYWRDYPSPMQQILDQVPRHELEAFVAGEGWANPDRVVTAVDYGPEPDWAWWEPRHDQPWRRQAARDREAGL